MKNHTDLLNLIAKQIKAKSYLEIGVFNPEHNFNHVNVAFKEGVDPDPNANATHKITSDDFFKSKDLVFNPDLIFIDGLHHAEQVRKDIENAFRILNKGGAIVIHDSNPHSEHITHVPRDNREWTGDVYKTICQITSPKFTVDFDYGCCVIRNDDGVLHFNGMKYEWEHFDENRNYLLNLVSIETAKKVIESWV